MQRWIRVLVPLAIIALWLAAAAFGGPTFGKLDQVSSNDQASFLPASAESTRVREWEQKFSDSETIPAVVILEAENTISKKELEEYAALPDQLSQVPGVVSERSNGGGIVGPIPSEDKRAVEFLIPVADDSELGSVVSSLRSIMADAAPAGTTAYVTGPAGFTADLVDAFGGIDGILLGVALGAVFIILLAVYRSVVLPFLVLLTSVCALTGSILLIYWFAAEGWIQLSGQSQGILSILVIGAATDYALLLTARFREALTNHSSTWAALRQAYRASLEPIAASGLTVIIALLCLLFSDLNSNRSLGPIAAIGIAFALLATLTLLPAMLLLFGRVSFWPFRPRRHEPLEGETTSVNARPSGLEGLRGIWRPVAGLVARGPRLIWVGVLAVMLVGSAGLLQLQASGVPQSALILSPSNAVDGQDALARHFDAGSGSPLSIVAPEGQRQEVVEVLKQTDGISASMAVPEEAAAGASDPAAAEPAVRDGHVLINAVLDYQPDSQEAEEVVRQLRTAFDVSGSDALVGGVTAIALDTSVTAQADLVKIIPIVLAVILVILMLLLRSVLAPVILILSVVLSYATAMGVSAIVFNHVFGFPGADASVPLFGFVFLVALGIDYNIFLMTRVREESLRIGTRPGILRGLGVTGGVITSAGVVLAATFAALGVIPILFLAQIAFIVAFGVLLDTILVRSLLVPAVAYDLGRVIWWPSRLSRGHAAHRMGSPASDAKPGSVVDR